MTKIDIDPEHVLDVVPHDLREFEVTILFATENYEYALELAKMNLSENAVKVAKIREVHAPKRLQGELIERDMNGN